MKIRDLVKDWEQSARTSLTVREYAVRLPVGCAARIEALVEMYPRRTRGQVVTELLCAALEELERAFPYQPGDRVVAEDEQGDPIYEDVGPGPRFLALAQRHAKRLEEEASASAVAGKDPL